jgi:hypothetical protein
MGPDALDLDPDLDGGGGPHAAAELTGVAEGADG